MADPCLFLVGNLFTAEINFGSILGSVKFMASVTPYAKSTVLLVQMQSIVGRA